VNQKKLAQYKGRLAASEIAAGMNAARANATRLVNDAKILLDKGRYPSALALAILAIEEAGKTSILRALALTRSEEELKQAWREYRSHTSKNRLWPMVELIRKGARKLDDFASLVADGAEHPALLDQMKQIALYTDCLGVRNWSKPEKIVGKDLASAIVDTAEIFARGDDVSPREIQLWIEHLQPVWMTSKEAMEKGLVDWALAVEAEGLRSMDGDAVEKFIISGYEP
jgi:AbiV family abortive infection protein